MTQASVRGSRLERFLLLAISVGFLTAATASATDDPPKKDDAKKEEAKKEAPKEIKRQETSRFNLAPGIEPRVSETIQNLNKRLFAGWEENKLTPSKPCDDYEFIRRASLDIIGRIAKPEEIDRFMADPAPT